MSTTSFAPYEALKRAGVDDDLARKAAESVVGADEKSHLATKADLLDLKVSLIQWTVATILAATGLFAGIVKLLLPH
jgi:hypothetical protein